MKYAFMSFSCPELDFPAMLSAAKEYGYDGVEPRVTANHAHGIEPDASLDIRKQRREQAMAEGIAIACVATSCRYADPETAQDNVDETLRSIDLAADVGAPAIRVFGGVIPKGIEREAAIDAVAASLRKTADHARARGVVVCMETHDAWCNPEHVAEVMRRVNHDAIAVNWDIMHPVRTGNGTIESSFEELKPWIRHLHVHDGVDTGGKLQLVPIGQGTIDHRRAIELLGTVDFQGYISGEWINWSDPYDVHLPRELAALRSCE